MSRDIITKLITVAVIILGMLLCYTLLAKLIKKVFKIKTKKINQKKQLTLMNFFINVLRILSILIATLMILSVFGIDTGAIITSLGAITVVVGLAFQDILKDFIAGIALIFQDNYNIGDWVTINNFKGEVINVGLRQTKIKAFGGETLIINNGSITEVINHTTENSTAIVDVKIAYESNIDKVEKVLNKLCGRLQNELTTLKGDVQLLGIEELGESAIKFRIVAEVEAGTQFTVQREIRKEVKLELDKNNIKIPYNQLVIHNE